MDVVTVIGAGNSGLSMAGHLSLLGYRVRIWSRTQSKVEAFSTTNEIHCSGVISGTAKVELFTGNIQEAVDGSRTILVTTPANAHPEIAELLAPFVKDNMTIMLNPGRTGGLLEFSSILARNGCLTHPVIAEAQTIIYTCRATHTNHVSIVGLKNDVMLASYRKYGNDLVRCTPDIPEGLARYFIPADNLTQTSIGNVGMILHCAPTILNAGWIECPVAQFKYYYQGISPAIAGLLEKMDKERLDVSRALGTGVESTADWLKRSYGITGDCLADCIQNNEAYAKIEAPETLEHRYIFEDIPCGLVPMECFADFMNIPVPYTTMIIDMASALVGRDLRACGRTRKTLGIDGLSRKQLINLFSR